jgi:hypothetical protein
MSVRSSALTTEKYRVLLPFSKEGFKCGEKVVHVVDPDQRPAVTEAERPWGTGDGSARW